MITHLIDNENLNLGISVAASVESTLVASLTYLTRTAQVIADSSLISSLLAAFVTLYSASCMLAPNEPVLFNPVSSNRDGGDLFG